MSGRSPSTGVASLRARFEQSGEKTSPPSRGRSPAESVTSDSSRNLSKVRTSFVAVEPSGRMAPELGLKETDKTNDTVAKDGVDDKKPAMNGSTEKPKANGSNVPHNGFANEDKTSARSAPINNADGATEAASKGKPDNVVSIDEDDTAGMLQSDSKDAGAVSGGAALADQTPGLGSILKGSPFEEKEAKETKKANLPKFPKPTPKPSAITAVTQAPKPDTKAPAATAVNGSPKEVQAKKPALQSMPATTPVNGKPREAERTKPTPEMKPKAAAPETIKTRSAALEAPSNVADAPVSGSKKDIAPAPRTPTSTSTSGKQASPKKPSPVKAASPKAAPAKEAPKEDVANEVKRPTSRPPGMSKALATTAPKAHATSAPKSAPSPTTSSAKPPTKKTGPSSPSASAFTKPKAKSPTRPVKLPASATAPTAASVAKLEGTAPSTGDRRPVNMASVAKEKGPSTRSHLKAKPGRASMPGGSKPATEKPKAKPRTSMASTKTAEGGFLERMMRPTQSSAQKTHEKLESKSPPRKTHPMKPRVTSGGDRGHKGHGDMGLDKLEEKSALASHPGAEEAEAQTESSVLKLHEKVPSDSHPKDNVHASEGTSDGDHGKTAAQEVGMNGVKK